MQNTCAPFQGHFRLIQCSSLYFGNMMKLPEKYAEEKSRQHIMHILPFIFWNLSNVRKTDEELLSGVTVCDFLNLWCLVSICVGVTVHSFGVESICLTKLCFGRQSTDPLLLSVRLKDCSRLRKHPRREEDSSLRSHVNTQECRSVTTHN